MKSIIILSLFIFYPFSNQSHLPEYKSWLVCEKEHTFDDANCRISEICPANYIKCCLETRSNGNIYENDPTANCTIKFAKSQEECPVDGRKKRSFENRDDDDITACWCRCNHPQRRHCAPGYSLEGFDCEKDEDKIVQGEASRLNTRFGLALPLFIAIVLTFSKN